MDKQDESRIEEFLREHNLSDLDIDNPSFEALNQINTKHENLIFTLQLGNSFLENDPHAKRSFLLNQLSNILIEFGESNALKKAFFLMQLRSEAEKRWAYFPHFLQSYDRTYLNELDHPNMAFRIVFKFGREVRSKTIFYQGQEKEIRRLYPDVDLSEYVFIDYLDYYELMVYHLMLSSIKWHLHPSKGSSTKNKSAVDLFPDKQNWEELKIILKNKGFIDDSKNWHHLHGNKSDIAILTQTLRDYKVIRCNNLSSAARLMYQEFGLEVGKDISSRMVTYTPSEKNLDAQEFDAIVLRLIGIK